MQVCLQVRHLNVAVMRRPSTCILFISSSSSFFHFLYLFLLLLFTLFFSFFFLLFLLLFCFSMFYLSSGVRGHFVSMSSIFWASESCLYTFRRTTWKKTGLSRDMYQTNDKTSTINADIYSWFS